MCSALLLAASSIGAAAAHADPNPPTGPAGSSEIDRYMEAKGNTFLDSQKQLSDFKHWITEQPGIEQAGYVEQVNNAETRSSKILWKGPSILRDAVKTEGQARGISVTFSERPYSLPEIRAAIKGIDAQKNAIAALGFQIEGIVGVRDDDGAIAVEGHAIPPSQNKRRARRLGWLTGSEAHLQHVPTTPRHLTQAPTCRPRLTPNAPQDSPSRM